MTRVRIDDVVIAHAVFLEEPLVIARGRDRRVGERNPGDHFSLPPARDANPHPPGLAEPVYDDAAVAAGADIHARIAARLQYIDAPVHRVALGDAAQIDAHAFLRKL